MGNQRRGNRSRNQRRAIERDHLLQGNDGSRGKAGTRGGSPSNDDEWQTLNAQIGALENFLTGAAQRSERQRRQRLQNILPPPESVDPRGRGGQRMSRWQERNHYGERQRHGISFFVLFCAVCALLWWLLRSSAGM